jgi:hypothetical protein
MKLANAFGINDSIRTKTFEYGGHTFKVKIPTTAETEAMYERIKVVPDDEAEKRYEEMAKGFLDNREKYESDPDVQFQENDIKVKDYSLRETAKNKVMTETRIVEMFRLLLPKEAEFDMSQVTYSDVDEIFPFKVQLEMVDEIASLIAPTYGETKKK